MKISSIGQPIALNGQFEKLFCELYTSQRQVLYEFVLSKVHSRTVAEDIVQDVFLKLWSLKDTCATTIENYHAFLYRMAYNEAISVLRKEKIKHRVLNNLFDSASTELNLTEQVIYERQLESLLQRAIQTLPPQRKKVYVLGKIEGIPSRQIAKIMGIANRTVAEMMRLSNQQVRKYINEQMNMNRKRKYPCTKKAAIKRAVVKVKTLEAA